MARAVLVQVLVYHQRLNAGACACGWGQIGESHAEHVAEVFEMELAVLEEEA
jgi:hypothetical protein